MYNELMKHYIFLASVQKDEKLHEVLWGLVTGRDRISQIKYETLGNDFEKVIFILEDKSLEQLVVIHSNNKLEWWYGEE